MPKRKRYGEFKMTRPLASYLETALWSSTGDDGEPLDKEFTIYDLPESELNKAKRDLDKFMAKADALPQADEGPSESFESQSMEKVAHDFWLTRNGHGAGFWDGDYPEALGAQLTAIAEKFGEVDIYVGDDGKLYFSP